MSSGRRYIPPRPSKRLQQSLPFEAFDQRSVVPWLGLGRRHKPCGRRRGQGEQVGTDHRVFPGQQHDSLQHVRKLSYVARPGIGEDGRPRLGRQHLER